MLTFLTFWGYGLLTCAAAPTPPPPPASPPPLPPLGIFHVARLTIIRFFHLGGSFSMEDALPICVIGGRTIFGGVVAAGVVHDFIVGWALHFASRLPLAFLLLALAAYPTPGSELGCDEVDVGITAHVLVALVVVVVLRASILILGPGGPGLVWVCPGGLLGT